MTETAHCAIEVKHKNIPYSTNPIQEYLTCSPFKHNPIIIVELKKITSENMIFLRRLLLALVSVGVVHCKVYLYAYI